MKSIKLEGIIYDTDTTFVLYNFGNDISNIYFVQFEMKRSINISIHRNFFGLLKIHSHSKNTFTVKILNWISVSELCPHPSPCQFS